MTVSSTTNRKTFAGNGVTTSFATSPVVFFDTSDLVLTVVTDSTGASEALVENTDYTVTGGSGSTGTVSLAGGSSPYGAPAAGTTLVIRRVLPLTQDDDFLNNDINDAEVLEDALDRLVMVAQQLDEGNELGVRLSSDETATDALTVLPFDRANKYLGFDASKELVALAAPTNTALTTAYSETLLAAANAPAARVILDSAESVITTKGDLYVGGAAGAESRKAVSTNGKILTAASGQADGLLWEFPQSIEGYVKNLSVVYATAASITITADAVLLRNTDGAYFRASSVSVSPSLAASGANGLDTGAEGSNTWYYGWVIAKEDGTVAGLLSTSSTAPTMPADYTFKALVTAVRNDGSSNLLSFRQGGSAISFNAQQNVLSGGSVTNATPNTSVTVSSFVPPIAKSATYNIRGNISTGGGGGGSSQVSMGSVSGSTQFMSSSHVSVASGSGYGSDSVELPYSGTAIYYAWTDLTGANISARAADIWVLGFRIA